MIFKHISVFSSTILISLIILATLLISGCSGSGGGDVASPEMLAEIQKKREKEQAAERAEYKKKQAEKEKEQQRKKREAAEKKAEADAARQRLLGQGRLTEHPPLFDDWTDKDFYIAKVEQDRRLLEAIEYLADGCKDPTRAVRLLGELISPDTPLTKEELEKLAAKPAYKYDKQVQLLAQALVVRDTDESNELVEKIVTGQIPTDAQGVAISTAIETIANFPTPRNEPIFLDVFRQRSEGTDTLLETILAKGASASFRLTLAEYSIASNCSEHQRQNLWKILCQEDPRNLSATLLLYREDRLPESYRKILERQFASLAQSAVCQVCGFASEVEGRDSEKSKRPSERRSSQAAPISGIQRRLAALSSNRDEDAEAADQVQKNLWTDSFAQLLTRRLYQVNSLEEDGQLILLAMNTPHAEPRQMLGEVLLRNWQETPAKLDSIGFPEKVIVEPGFWVVAKRVLNESGTGNGSGRRGRSSAEMADPLRLAWQASFGKLLVRMCNRFDAAGKPVYTIGEVTGASTTVSDEVQAAENSTDTFSLASLLHPKARPVTEYKLQMPNDSISVHYLRCEELAQPEALLKYYRGKLGCPSELSGPSLCWLGTFEEEKKTEEDTLTETAPGKFRSIDVLLTIEQPGRFSDSLSGKAELSIEILLISSK